MTIFQTFLCLSLIQELADLQPVKNTYGWELLLEPLVSNDITCSPDAMDSEVSYLAFLDKLNNRKPIVQAVYVKYPKAVGNYKEEAISEHFPAKYKKMHAKLDTLNSYNTQFKRGSIRSF